MTEPLTEKLTLFVCFASIFCRVMTFICYIEVDFTFGLLDCVRYNEDFVISRFCPIRFTVTLAGLKNIVRYTDYFVIMRGSLNRDSTVIIISHFSCGTLVVLEYC